MNRLHITLRILSTVIAAIASLSSVAQDVSYNRALAIANEFFKSHGVEGRPETIHRAKGMGDESATYYIINADGAFAVVSGLSSVGPILAYSLDAPYNPDNAAPAAAALLDEYDAYIRAVADGELPSPAPSRISPSHDVLLSTATWNQGPTPWNDACPQIDGVNCIGGCAATAMSIMMKYYSWPTAAGHGSKSYTPYGFSSTLSVNFSAADYHISSIPADGQLIWASWSQQQRDDVARLIYHAGVAANMDYGVQASGTTDIYAMIGMARYFGYTLGGYVKKDTFTDVDDYLQIIIDELDGGHPTFYSGYDPIEGGHMFICDGYDTSGRLHFNFGWSGLSNAYYYITPGSLRFYESQTAIVGVYPDTTGDGAPLMFMYNASETPSLSIDTETVNRGQPFTLKIRGISNTSDDVLNARYAINICSADGSVKEVIYQRTIDTQMSKGVSWNVDYRTALPVDYEYEPGDRITIFVSTDGGATWQPAPCYRDGENSISLDGIYDTAIKPHLKMTTIGSECKGLTLAADSEIKADGSAFTVEANYVGNLSGIKFVGDVAVYLCDDTGEPRQAVGTVTGITLNNNYFDYKHSITCSIPAGTVINPGDRLMAFCRYEGEDEWVWIDCDVDEKAYILIPESLCAPAETITFATLMTVFSSANDLDFAEVTDFQAYKLLYQDRETLILEPISKLKSGDGALLLGANLTAGVYTDEAAITTGVAALTDNLLVGVLTDTAVDNNEADATNYIFRATASEIGFYLAAGETVPAGSGYLRLPMPPTSAPARYALYMSGDYNGIVGVACDAPADTPIYNLQGIRVAAPTAPGVYIINGKKVIIR